MNESEEEEEASDSNQDDDTTSNTSKKREREEILVRRIARKAEKDNSMEIDEDDIAIVGVKPGVAKKPSAKKTPPRHSRRHYRKYGNSLMVNRATEGSSIHLKEIPPLTAQTDQVDLFQIKPESR